MPSLQEVSFAVIQKFNCVMCSNEWSSTVKVPQAGMNCREHTTIELALKKALHASGSVLYGNIGIRDVHLDDFLRTQKLKDCQGVIELQCKPNHSQNRTCPDCMYTTNNCKRACRRDVDGISTGSGYRLTQLLDQSLHSGITEANTERNRSTTWYQSVEERAGPLDENIEPMCPHDCSHSPTYQSANSSQRSLVEATAPTPAPRLSLRSFSTISTNIAGSPQDERKISDGNSIGTATDRRSCSTSSTTASTCTQTTYDYPMPYHPPVPPKENNIFHYRIPADQIRDAMRRTRDCFAVVELEVKDGDGAKLRSPYVILCSQLKDGHKIVLETTYGELFIHQAQKFRTLKSLLAFYAKNKTGCGVHLRNQLTKSEFQRYRDETHRRDTL